VSAQSADYDAAIRAIQARIDAIRAGLEDVVPGDYQHGYADGLESAIAEIRYVIPPASMDAGDE
jgi:hypothetical protein